MPQNRQRCILLPEILHMTNFRSDIWEDGGIKQKKEDKKDRGFHSAEITLSMATVIFNANNIE